MSITQPTLEMPNGKKLRLLDDGQVSGIVSITLDDLIDRDRGELMSFLSERLTGSPDLGDVTILPVSLGRTGTRELSVAVFGDPTPILENGHEYAFEVHLDNVGNPDLGQDPARRLPGTENARWAGVSDWDHASRVCREYIEEHDLGGGNWSGGKVRDAISKEEMGYVSYNGRAHVGEGNRMPYSIAAPTPGL